MKEPWTQLSTEPIVGRAAIGFVRALVEACEASNNQDESSVEPDLDSQLEFLLSAASRSIRNETERSWATTLAPVLIDLHRQGWSLAYQKNHLFGTRPEAQASREALRGRLHVRRDQQLSEPSVVKFLDSMETWRSHRGKRTSILSLLRDGRELIRAFNSAAPGEQVVQPYLQFVSPTGKCEHTGLRLMDIWRYFRHTWANPYESVPGRSLLILVRDAAAVNHPIVGIAALSSAAVRLGPRDRFIGWDTDDLVGQLNSGTAEASINWVRSTIEKAISEVYRVDFIREGILPTDARLWEAAHAIELRQVSDSAREAHHRLMSGQSYKSIDPKLMTDADWVSRAEMPLFRSKRALELATLIDLKLALAEGERALDSGARLGKEVLSRVVKIARSKSVGTEIADLTVCGAVAPYSHVAAGKLVALLAVSPAAVAEYHDRYCSTPGIISSSVAGRAITRPTNLCYVGTTSLYGKRPNQYDRLSMPAEVVGGPPQASIRYQFIRDIKDSRTQGVGTFQFASTTLKALENYVSAKNGGWRVNNVFGEGTSPKLRGLRDGFAAIGMNSDKLLVHGIEKCIYGVRLASNLDRYLLGIDKEPHWLFDRDLSDGGVLAISSWWQDRWAGPRLVKTAVIEKIKRETLVYPIRHSARVPRPPDDTDQEALFEY